jgi:hypothetical protein
MYETRHEKKTWIVITKDLSRCELRGGKTYI